MKPLSLRPPWRLSRPFLLTAVLLLAGCPYGSEFPLGDSKEAIVDASLLGSWKPSAESEEDFTLSFSSSGGAPLTVTADSPGEEPASYPAFVSAIGGELFLNLRDAGESGLWYFANYRLDGGRLRLRLVDDELFESQVLPGAAALRAFLQRHLEDPRLYGGQGAEEWDWVLERVIPGADSPASPCQSRTIDAPLQPQQVHQVEGAGAVA